jgi:hypothetical protein
VKTLARNGSRPVQNSPVNLVLVAEVDEQSRAFDAMKLMFEIRHADTDLHIQKHRKGDAKFWAMVEQYRKRERAKKAEAAEADEQTS